jgi:uncharacterized protein YbcI
MEQDLAADTDRSSAAEAPPSALLELANAMVSFYKDTLGRGPTRARAYFAGPDTVVVLLQNTLTVAERNLVALDEHTRLRDARVYFQYAVEKELRALAERTLGRRTVAFVSGIDTRNDVAAEVFTLEPVGKSALARQARY